jgi:hypothetical protein
VASYPYGSILAGFAPAASTGASSTAPGVTAPAAAATLATTTPPAGQYQVQVNTYLDGTLVAGTDDDNFRFHLTGTGGYTINMIQPAVAGLITTSYFQVVLNGANAVTVQTIAAGSASAVYHAQVVITGIVPA